MVTGIKNAADKPAPAHIQERLTRQILRSVMAQFQSLPEALLELVDNAVDEFDSIHGGQHLDVNLVITKSHIVVENIGGKGMGINELRTWLSWGEPHKKDAIGEYGQGGKAAMGYLGSAWIVQTKRWDELWLWEIKENKWDDISSTEKSYKAVPRPCDSYDGRGYCKFEVRNLKKHRQDIKRIKTVLSNIYRTHIEEGRVTIALNYEPVPALSLPLYDKFGKQEFHQRTHDGFKVGGWVGRLKRDIRVRGQYRIIGGMRLLRRGRLIREGEYFGHPDFKYKASLGTLIGEVELTKVPVLPNKTGFDMDSPEWEDVRKVMYEILKPHIQDLLSEREEDTVTREERKIVSEVRQMMIDAFKLLAQYSDFTALKEEERGRKQPQKLTKEAEVAKTETPQQDLESDKPYEPRTPPPPDALGRLRRLGRMPEWELKILQPDIRSDWGEKEGHRCLLINKKYCLYEERDGDELYIAETAALELAEPEVDEKLTVKDYLDKVNSIMRAFCEIYNPTKKL